MNKELILKYKTEFDHWLNGGELLIRNNDENIWINMTKVHWDMNYKTVSIIIKDEFSELRKALCDGKIIQIWGVLEQHVSEASKDIYGWKDIKSFKHNSTFRGEIHDYRIKPEEPKFKAGDFVKTPTSIAIVIEHNGKLFASNNYDLQDCTKWKPSHKELCYFTHDTNTKTSAILREFREISKDGFYVDCFGARFIYCEPFLNSKPTWFK